MKWQYILAAAVMMAALWAWMQYRARLTPEQLQTLRDAVSAGAKIVDVRTPAEFSTGHIDGAVNVPLGELGSQVKKLRKLGKKKPLLIYCRSGNRSAQAVSFLRGRGFADVLDLKTMGHWRQLRAVE